MSQITYTNKVALNQNNQVADINKVKDTDMNEIKTVVNTNTPIGCIQIYAGSTAPTGWLMCDGSAISRTTYVDLFSVIGTTYGSGDGSTTFNLPNLCGKVIVGQDTTDVAFDTLGETGGEKNHKLTIDELPSHSHWTYYSTDADGLAQGIVMGTTKTASNSITQGRYVNTQPAGGNGSHNNLQPYIVMNYIISY